MSTKHYLDKEQVFWTEEGDDTTLHIDAVRLCERMGLEPTDENQDDVARSAREFFASKNPNTPVQEIWEGMKKAKAVHNPEEQAELRALSNEIKELLVKHDVAGMVNIIGKDSSEFLMHIEPSWSCLTFEKDPDGKPIALRFKSAMKTGSPEEKERGRLTISMVCGFLDLIVIQFGNLNGLKQMLAEHVEIYHVQEEGDIVRVPIKK